MVNEVKRVVALPVVGYEGLYEVTSDGEVYSLNYNKTGERVKLKAAVNKANGYLHVILYKDGNRRCLLIHRLVAEAFIPNPECKPQIDHINTIRTDNRVENLRWCTDKENNNNPITLIAHKVANTKIIAECRSKAVYCVELDKVFESAHEAARQLGLDRGTISACCIGKNKSTGGYHFRFA